MNDIDIFSVNEINFHLKNILESNVPNLYVEGEISNFIRHSSGHIYFSLKDDSSSIRCVFFKQNNYSLGFFPRNGNKVIVFGKITLYVKGGNYQINVLNMYDAGKGILQIKFEQLKNKLQSQGYFDAQYKKVLPKFPKKIGVITSKTGAAFQDIKNVIFRRYPVELILFPATVQGDMAVSEVVKGIEYFSNSLDVDVIILARGGGSQEDLFVFNSEEIAQAIFDCPIPIITGIGHEIDFSIADFVADLRTPTPSAAAEIAVPDRNDLINTLHKYRREIAMKIDSKLSKHHQLLTNRELRLSRMNIPQQVGQHRLELHEIIKKYQEFGRLGDYISQKFQLLKNRFDSSFTSTKKIALAKHSNQLENIQKRLNDNWLSRHDKEIYNLTILKNNLENKSPQKILSKGYAYITKADTIVASSKELKAKDEINISFSDGSVKAVVKKSD